MYLTESDVFRVSLRLEGSPEILPMLRYLFRVATTTARNRREKSELDALISLIERDGVGPDRETTLAKINALLNAKNPLLTVATLRRISHALGPEAYIAFGDPLD